MLKVDEITFYFSAYSLSVPSTPRSAQSCFTKAYHVIVFMMDLQYWSKLSNLEKPY
ncbi:hypothetical protein A359_04700 [secondary endosymbiont of Ctenarytaina eucalypti]|uniref:Uncharacterized protein n=1 Tax=secondary endosymbiont of Ctenarytaina eucalypti TaxID=1199245 RepID=J3YRY7_9ENTR|nr:hypothetical protein A359_04700 [secondary endosymbiont of Ctenarytaina eucalypti]